MMKYSLLSALVLMYLSFIQTGHASITKIESEEFEVKRAQSVDKFNLRISEKGTKFNEKIAIDQKKDIEYIKVPAHNGLSASDNLYDFKMNITVQRMNKDRACYISPLPPNLPRPDVLTKGLKKMSSRSPIHQIKKTIQQWAVGDRVDKSTLRQEVRDFCGQFPIYRLKPFTADSVSVDGRSKRSSSITNWPLCNKEIPKCHPNDWLFSCRIRTTSCVYYVICKSNTQTKTLECKDLKHLYSSFLCCSPKCPSSG